MIINYLKRRLNTKQRRKIRKLFVDLTYPVLRYDLSTLAKYCGTDKSGFHEYTSLYESHFANLKNKNIKLLEIGIGGYSDPHYGGNSLRMWKNFFSFGIIYGIDIFDKSELTEKRIKTFQGDQADLQFLSRVTNEIGTLDIIIDDGSHKSNDIINSFNNLFPKLSAGGIYVIEDTLTSYLNSYGGDSLDLDNPKTTMNFFKKMVDYVNQEEFDKNIIPDGQNFFSISEIHFYHNIIFVYKSKTPE